MHRDCIEVDDESLGVDVIEDKWDVNVGDRVSVEDQVNVEDFVNVGDLVNVEDGVDVKNGMDLIFSNISGALEPFGWKEADVEVAPSILQGTCKA